MTYTEFEDTGEEIWKRIYKMGFDCYRKYRLQSFK